jgi:c-di-GMP-binding flagellar brake protein YcgR
MWAVLGLFQRKVEKRGIPRYRLEVPLTVSTPAGQSHHGVSRDLSEGGMGAILRAELPVGEQVCLQYQLPDGSPPKKIAAVVQWHKGSRYGFKFVER